VALLGRRGTMVRGGGRSAVVGSGRRVVEVRYR
jgi:hypothetical protein